MKASLHHHSPFYITPPEITSMLAVLFISSQNFSYACTNICIEFGVFFTKIGSYYMHFYATYSFHLKICLGDPSMSVQISLFHFVYSCTVVFHSKEVQ